MRVKLGGIYLYNRDKVLVIKLEKGKCPLVNRLPNHHHNHPFYVSESFLNKCICKLI